MRSLAVTMPNFVRINVNMGRRNTRPEYNIIIVVNEIYSAAVGIYSISSCAKNSRNFKAGGSNIKYANAHPVKKQISVAKINKGT